MAYQRRTIRKRRFKKKAWYNKSYSAKSLAIKAIKNIRYIKGLVNSEMLHKDVSFTPAAQFGITSLVGIDQGDTDSGRTGNSILLRSLYLRGSIQINPSVTGNTRIMLALVKDSQQISDTTPNVSNIFTSITDPDGALLNLNNAGRFKILWRQSYILTPSNGSRPAVEINKYFKLYSHVRFNGTTATDIQKNAYYLVMINSENTNYPSISITSRIGYHDN